MGSIIPQAITGDQYARDVGVKIRRWRVYDPDYALEQDPEIYAKIRRDPIVAHAIQYRKHLVAGRDWFIESPSDHAKDRLAAQILEGLIRGISSFATARFNLSDAILKGATWARIHGEFRPLLLGDGKCRKWYVVSRLRDVDKQRFRLVSIPAAEGGGWRWEIHQSLLNSWGTIDRGHFVRHTYDDSESSLSHGRGLAEALYYWWWMKATVVQRGLDYLDRWSGGFVTAAIDAAAMGTPDSQDSDDRRQKWVDAIERMRAQHILVYDRRDEFRVVDPPTGGWAAAREALVYYDNGITRLILGSVLPTGGGGEVGSFARASVEENSTEALVQYDRVLLEETIQRDIVTLLWRANSAHIAALGLAGRPPGHFRIRQEKRDDPQLRAQGLLLALQAGLAIRRDEAYAQLGWTPPALGDETIEIATPPGGTSATGPGLGPGTTPGNLPPGAPGMPNEPPDAFAGTLNDTHEPMGALSQPLPDSTPAGPVVEFDPNARGMTSAASTVFDTDDDDTYRITAAANLEHPSGADILGGKIAPFAPMNHEFLGEQSTKRGMPIHPEARKLHQAIAEHLGRTSMGIDDIAHLHRHLALEEARREKNPAFLPEWSKDHSRFVKDVATEGISTATLHGASIATGMHEARDAARASRVSSPVHGYERPDHYFPTLYGTTQHFLHKNNISNEMVYLPVHGAAGKHLVQSLRGGEPSVALKVPTALNAFSNKSDLVWGQKQVPPDAVIQIHVPRERILASSRVDSSHSPVGGSARTIFLVPERQMAISPGMVLVRKGLGPASPMGAGARTMTLEDDGGARTLLPGTTAWAEGDAPTPTPAGPAPSSGPFPRAAGTHPALRRPPLDSRGIFTKKLGSEGTGHLLDARDGLAGQEHIWEHHDYARGIVRSHPHTASYRDLGVSEIFEHREHPERAQLHLFGTTFQEHARVVEAAAKESLGATHAPHPSIGLSGRAVLGTHSSDDSARLRAPHAGGTLSHPEDHLQRLYAATQALIERRPATDDPDHVFGYKVIPPAVAGRIRDALSRQPSASVKAGSGTTYHLEPGAAHAQAGTLAGSLLIRHRVPIRNVIFDSRFAGPSLSPGPAHVVAMSPNEMLHISREHVIDLAHTPSAHADVRTVEGPIATSYARNPEFEEKHPRGPGGHFIPKDLDGVPGSASFLDESGGRNDRRAESARRVATAVSQLRAWESVHGPAKDVADVAHHPNGPFTAFGRNLFRFGAARRELRGLGGVFGALGRFMVGTETPKDRSDANARGFENASEFAIAHYATTQHLLASQTSVPATVYRAVTGAAAGRIAHRLSRGDAFIDLRTDSLMVFSTRHQDGPVELRIPVSKSRLFAVGSLERDLPDRHEIDLLIPEETLRVEAEFVHVAPGIPDVDDAPGPIDVSAVGEKTSDSPPTPPVAA